MVTGLVVGGAPNFPTTKILNKSGDYDYLRLRIRRS